MKEELQKLWFCYDSETEQYTTPVDEEVRFFEAPTLEAGQQYSDFATTDIWTLTYNGQVYIVSKGDYNSVEIN